MDQQDNQDQAAGAKRRKDRGKLIFGAVIAVVVILVYIFQLGGGLPDWPDDLSGALIRAKQENRNVLIFFAGDPPSTNAQDMSRTTLQKNAAKITDGKFIKLLIKIKKTDELAERYKIKRLPTFLLLDPQGKELDRRSKFVGQADFGKFLNCSKVEKP
jgi:hypothetical protein